LPVWFSSIKNTQKGFETFFFSRFLFGRWQKWLAIIFLDCTETLTFAAHYADVAKLADAPDLGSGAARRVGSTPIIRTHRILNKEQGMMNEELLHFDFPCSLFVIRDLTTKKHGYSYPTGSSAVAQAPERYHQ
jgi:hypothetical protein